MSRTQKLFNRLDELEDEYRRLAAAQFNSMTYGGYSLFLARKMPLVFGGLPVHAKDREGSNHFDRLEKEIEVLRTKLDQPLSDSPIQRVRNAASHISAARESGEGTEFKIAIELAREFGYSDGQFC